jgi:ribosomal protein L27
MPRKAVKGQGGGGGDEDALAQLVTLGVLAAVVVLAVGMILLIGTKNAANGFSQIYLVEKTLPPAIGAGVPYPVSFAIENFEGRDAAYSYSIGDANGSVMKTGGAIVGKGGRRTIRESIVLRQRGTQKIFITVKVDGGRELSLFFTVNVV